jgi:hypothetical protein
MTRTSTRRTTAMAAVSLTAVAGLALTACNNTSAAPTGSARSAASDQATPSPTMSMPNVQAARLSQYDPRNQPGATFYASVLSGLNEIPNTNGEKTGDKNGTALALMRIQGDEVSFAFSWSGIGTPTAGHIHAGAFGVDGGVKIPFFTTKLPDGRSSVYGTVKVADRQLLADITAHPQNFYFNLHTADFPGGAVRGQVFGIPTGFNLLSALADTTVKSVITGDQIYACTNNPNGSATFTQENVDAHLQGGIHHTFKNPGPAGPPQWVAQDGSAVTGKVLAKFDNGPGNIPVLALQAAQEGASHGLLSHTMAVFRLNTKGGVAPAGTCSPATQPTASVPYRADYLFLGGAQ